ncbi:MAG: hypothetical protein ACJ786_40380 [Catenulispora sp.]
MDGSITLERGLDDEVSLFVHIGAARQSGPGDLVELVVHRDDVARLAAALRPPDGRPDGPDLVVPCQVGVRLRLRSGEGR